MRILFANYRYFVSSGPERYLFNVTDRLTARGHTVMPFSVRYAQNLPTPHDKYFVSPIGAEDEVFFDQHKRSLGTIQKAMTRLFYSREVENAVLRMIDETQPDIAYVLYYLRKMSPSLLVGIKKRKIPLVVRISDYGMMCGEHHMLLDDKPCTACIDTSILAQVRNKCVKNSLPLSAIDALATTFHRQRGYFDLIDRFITTNPFMTEMMVRAGFDAGKIQCVPTFTDMTKFTPGSANTQKPYFAYVGRLDRPKGVHVMIEAMGLLRDKMGAKAPTLKIAGAGHTAEYVEWLHALVKTLALEDVVEFMGGIPSGQVPDLFRGATAALMPALWYENLPNSVVEAFACRTPVITSRIGSLTHTVTDEQDGLHFAPGDAGALANALERMASDSNLRERLAEGALATANRSHNPEKHIDDILTLFDDLLVQRPVETQDPALAVT